MIYYKSSIKMDEIDDNSIQTIVTSPPYPMIAKWDDVFTSQISEHLLNWTKVDYDKIGENNMFRLQHIILYRVFLECYRKMIDGGIMCVNIGDATRKTKQNGFTCYPNFARVVENCMSIGFVPLIPILWKKISNRPNAFLGSGFLPVNAYVSQDVEYIAIFRKGGELRKFNSEEKILREESKLTKPERDLYYSQIWEIQGDRKAKEHSGWPYEIFYRLLRMFSIKGDTILDPFCGRGNESTCEIWGRNYIGYTL
jgi:modification methylase